MTKENPGQATVVQSLVQAVRNAGMAAGGQPGGGCSIIWPDRNREWESVLESIRGHMPELYVYGSYDPSRQQGPALWLSCTEARVLSPSAPQDRTPVFYLPGIDSMEFGRRVFYAGPVHHRKCFVEEPPIPARILPPGYPLSELWSYLDSVITARRSDIVHYYRTLCE